MCPLRLLLLLFGLRLFVDSQRLRRLTLAYRRRLGLEKQLLGLAAGHAVAMLLLSSLLDGVAIAECHCGASDCGLLRPICTSVDLPHVQRRAW